MLPLPMLRSWKNCVMSPKIALGTGYTATGPEMTTALGAGNTEAGSPDKGERNFV